MKVLNMYAGIGGNRKLWEDVDVTAVEINEEIADVYRDHFPQDKVVVGDAHEYLEENYDRFDFIWASPPCPTHSKIRNETGWHEPKYPDMKLYQEVILLKHNFNGRWVVENVEPYYEPLLPGEKRGRHMFWSNFHIPPIEVCSDNIQHGKIAEWEQSLGFDLSDHSFQSVQKRKLLRNCVNPELGKHVLNAARNAEKQTLERFVNA